MSTFIYDEAQRVHKWSLILFVWMFIRFEWEIEDVVVGLDILYTYMYKCKRQRLNDHQLTHQYDILIISLGLVLKVWSLRLSIKAPSWKGTHVFLLVQKPWENNMYIWEINMEHLQTLMFAVSRNLIDDRPFSREIPGTSNSGTPIPILLLYHSHKNPLKYGNDMGGLWEGGPTIEGPWKNP